MHLPAISLSSGGLSLIELAHLEKVFTEFGLSDPVAHASLRLLLERLLIRVLSEASSGILLSPEESFHLIDYLEGSAGLLLSLEKNQLQPNLRSVPSLVQNWSVEHVRGNYAVASFELFYNPKEPEVVTKLQLLSELAEACKLHNIAFLVKLIVFPLAGEDQNLFDTQFTALAEVRGYCDALGVEFFEDPLHAATITTQLDIPWLVLERNVPYSVAKETIRTGVENGARGFLVSDILWFDFVERLEGAEVTPALLEQYVQGTVRDRILELNRILNEAVLTNDQLP